MADIYIFKYNNLQERKNINKSVLWKVTKIDRINMSIKIMKNPILITLALHLRTDLLPQQISRNNWPLFQINQIINARYILLNP